MEIVYRRGRASVSDVLGELPIRLPTPRSGRCFAISRRRASCATRKTAPLRLSADRVEGRGTRIGAEPCRAHLLRRLGQHGGRGLARDPGHCRARSMKGCRGCSTRRWKRKRQMSAGGGLVDLLVRSSLLLAMIWLAAACVRKAGGSAAMRHMIWLFGLGALLLFPLFTALMPPLHLPILPATASPPPEIVMSVPMASVPVAAEAFAAQRESIGLGDLFQLLYLDRRNRAARTARARPTCPCPPVAARAAGGKRPLARAARRIEDARGHPSPGGAAHRRSARRCR